MKIYVRAIISVVLFTSVSLVPALHALTGTEIKVNVPFAFNCGARYYAPGAYTFDFLDPNVMLLRRGLAGQALIIFTRQNDLVAAKSGYLAFTKIGDHYFLDGIRIQGSAVDVSINERKWEKRAAVEMALEGQSPTRVEVALLDQSGRAAR